MDDYTTDYSNIDKNKAIKQLIDSYGLDYFYNIINITLPIIEKSKYCLYCHTSIRNNEVIFNQDNIRIGSFCSVICCNIYRSMIRNIAGFHDDNYFIFVPFNILTEDSKIVFYNIISEAAKITNYDIMRFYTYMVKTTLHVTIYFLLDFTVCKNFNFKLDITNISTCCLYCDKEYQSNCINLTCKDIIFDTFCSIICKYSFSSIIGSSLLPLNTYNFRICPINMISNYNIFKKAIKPYINSNNMYMYCNYVYNNQLELSVYIPK